MDWRYFTIHYRTQLRYSTVWYGTIHLAETVVNFESDFENSIVAAMQPSVDIGLSITIIESLPLQCSCMTPAGNVEYNTVQYYLLTK
jgi:hypothetical protein